MAFPIANKLTSALLVAAGAMMVMAASPAQAKDAAGQAASGESDTQFRALFNEWKQLDQPVSAYAKVAVPSRMPVENVTLTSDYGMLFPLILGAAIAPGDRRPPHAQGHRPCRADRNARIRHG